MEEASRFVSRALDNIGYGSQMVRLRRDYWQQYALLENNMKLHSAGRHLILAGSKAEGVTSFYETDVDHMHILNDVLCVKDVKGLSEDALTVFQTDTLSSPPGYTKLKLTKFTRGINTALIKDSLFKGVDDNKYISSIFYMAEQRKEVQMRQSKLAKQNKVSYNEATGPAIPLSTSSCSLKADIVTGFLYRQPKALQSWAKRSRTNGWPPADVIKDLATRDGQVVPKGCRNTDTQFQDWRMCFVDSELQLTQCLCTTQIKHYILLKQITRDVLKSESEEITSYIVKNVCFWLAELLPFAVFREDNLIELCLASLTFLKYCISGWNYLPYYMIPERNLIAGKFSHTERRQISSLLEELVMEGPRVLLRCTKVREAMMVMYNTPEQLSVYGKKRDELETLKLRHALSTIAREYGVDTGDQCDNLRFKMADIVLPEWKFMRHVGSDVNKTINERVRQMLS